MSQTRLNEVKTINKVLALILAMLLGALFTLGCTKKSVEQKLAESEAMYLDKISELTNTISGMEVELQTKDAEVDRLSTLTEELQSELGVIDTIVEATGLPKSVALSLYKETKSTGLELPIVLAIVQTESNFRTDTVNHNTNGTIDVGIMQINSCHSAGWQSKYGEPYTIDNVVDPVKNIRFGLELLIGHLNNNNDDLTAALTAYNRGQGGMQKLRRNTGSAESSYSRLIYSRADYWRNIIS